MYRLAVRFMLVGLLASGLSAAPGWAQVGDRQLSEVAKEYVLWRTKVGACRQLGKAADSERAQARVQQLQTRLSAYSQTDVARAIQEAEAYYRQNTSREGC